MEAEDGPYYDIYASDGDLGFLFSGSKRNNHLHSTGQLCVFTIITLIDYNVKFGTGSSSSSYESECKFFNIIINGRNIKKIVGNPRNLPIEMRSWLNLYSIRLRKEAEMKIEAGKLPLACLNPSTEISKLTTGILHNICFGLKVERPVVQILALMKITNAEENYIYYSLDISDGQYTFQRVETQSFYFNNLVTAGIIKELAIISLDKFKLFDDNTRINITQFTVLNKDVKEKIGNNLVPVKLPKNDYRLRDNLLQSSNFPTHRRDMIINAACLADIQRGIAFSKPALQIIKFYNFGLLESYFDVSDGCFIIRTEYLSEILVKQIVKMKNITNALIKLDDYELSLVRETEELYK